MLPYLRSRCALALLLGFVLGGLATPLAHELGHLFDEEAEFSDDIVAVSPSHSSGDSHDCELCDVRIAAVEFAVQERSGGEFLTIHKVLVPQAVPHSPVRTFDGRAPPVLV